MADLSKIILPDNTEYNIKDANALPKTAGSSNAVTGDLYLTADGGRSILYTANGDRVLHISYETDGTFRVSSCDSSDSSLIGMASNTSNGVTLHANNGNVILRPLGLTDNSKQAYIDTSGDWHIVGGGQQIGGHPCTPYTKSSTSLSGGHTIVTTASGLTSSGVYMVSATFKYKASSSSAHWPTFGFGTSAALSAYEIINQPYIANANDRYITVSGLYTGHTVCSLIASTQSSSITATLSDALMRIVRLS